MAGPHRIVAAARNVLKTEFSVLEVGSPVVLAVSGGADSMALAVSAQFAARQNLLALHAVVVDHGIRAESAQEAALVVRRLTKLGISAQSVKISAVQKIEEENIGTVQNEGPEGSARRGRYLALARIARELGQQHSQKKPALVLLGHNADDQAESVILGLGRGSGARSIAGMPRAGRLPICPDVPMLRPLLDFTHAQMQTICTELGVEYVEDPSNQLDGPWRTAAGTPLRRARVRHEVLPLLDEVLGGGAVNALCRTAKLIQEDGEALTYYVQIAAKNCVIKQREATENLENNSVAEIVEISCLKLADYPRAIRTRVLRQAFLASGGRGGELVFWHLDTLDRLVKTHENNRSIDLPGVKAVKNQHIIKFMPLISIS